MAWMCVVFVLAYPGGGCWDVGAHGLLGVWFRDRGVVGWLPCILLASVGIGVMMPIPVIVMVVTVMPPWVVRIIVASSMGIGVMMPIPVMVVVTVVPARVVRRIIAAAIIRAAGEADSSIAAAAGNQDGQAAKE
jgi:hypothetical protein